MEHARCLQKFQDAAKCIEMEGLSGFPLAETIAGTDIALAILVTYLRTENGLAQLQRAGNNIDNKVATLLKDGLGNVARFYVQKHIPYYMDKSSVLDNFSSFAIFWRGFLWPTVEHAFQAAKFLGSNDALAARICKATSPYDAKAIAHEKDVLSFVREDWSSVKEDIMRELKRCKANQHPIVMDFLLASKDVILVENSETDAFWGRGPDLNGKNMDGELWMEYRDELLAGTGSESQY